MPLGLLAGADWSVCVLDLGTSTPLLAHEERRVLRTASVGKVFLLVEVARRAVVGELDLAELVAWQDEERVADSGLWHRLEARELSVHDLCVLVGAVSDNLATNALVRLVGLPAVTASTESLGYPDSRLLDRVRDDRGAGHPPTLSVGSAAELADLLGRLHREDVFGPEVSGKVLGWLAANTDLSMVASAFDLDPLAHAEPDRGIRLVNKTGTIDTARADVGVVTGPGASVAYAVLANWSAEVDLRDAVLGDMRAIGALIRRHITGSKTS